MVEPLVTVIIPNYNGRVWLPRLLDSLAGQNDPRLLVTIVDDASTDDSFAYVRDCRPEVNAIRNERNLGFAATCNVGLRAARTPFVVLLNNDTYVDPDWLAEGLRPFAAPDVAAVTSLVVLAAPPHLIDTAGDVYSVAGGAIKRNHLRPRESAASLATAVFSVSGASAFYRREALATVGWLDERFESYYEDVDLGFRLAWAGFRCVFAPASVCYHHLSSSYSPRGWRYHFNSARNAEVVWWADMPSRLRRKYLASHLAFLGLQAANKLRQRCLLPYLAGKWAAFRRIAYIRQKRAAVARLARVPQSRIEALLERDWWNLHVRSRVGSSGSREKAG